MTVRPDKLWKIAFRTLMPEFIEFFFPEKYNEIDWNKNILFLDKELQTIQPASRPKNRIADVLVMLHLKEGKPIWVLLHIEIQGYFDEFFAKRVHQMRYRIEDIFDANPVMLCIFTDDDPSFHPKGYTIQTWGVGSTTSFHTYKVMENPPTTYKKPNSIVATIMEVVYFSTRIKKAQDEDIMKMFIPIVKNLKGKGYSNQQISLVMAFIEAHVKFGNSDNYSIFDENINEMEEYEDVDQLVAEFNANPPGRFAKSYLKYLQREKEMEETREEMEETREEMEKTREKMKKTREEMEKTREEMERARQKIEEQNQLFEQERLKAEKERLKAEKEKKEKEHAVLLMLSQGIDTNLIIKALNLEFEQITAIQEKYKDNNPIDDLLKS